METEVQQLKHAYYTSKRKNTELRERNNQRKESVDETVRSTKPQPAPRGVKPSDFRSQASSETADSSPHCELQRELMKQLRETRKQLLNVQERLTVAEQVTAATQRRELIQEGFSPDSVYEEHDCTELQPTTHIGYNCFHYWL